ncbi:MAG: hypothetical protein IJ825_01825, partial [Oscillospiraceae bacterium]|nr:hypothetical protein [Oscillospiraceae bacterium]
RAGQVPPNDRWRGQRSAYSSETVTEPREKFLVQLFSKSWQELRRGELQKRSGGAFLQEGRPAIEGAPNRIAEQFDSVVGIAAPTPPEKVSQTLFRQSEAGHRPAYPL